MIVPFKDGVAYASPVLNAAGTFNPALLHTLAEADAFKRAMGALVLKTATRHPRAGNPQPRTVDLGAVGMLNSIGLQNPGLVAMLQTGLPQAHAHGLPVWLSVWGDDEAEWAEMAELIASHPHRDKFHVIEANSSCPNVAHHAMPEFKQATAGIRQLRAALPNTPIMTKLSPAEFGMHGLLAMAEHALAAGSTGITAINTLIGLAMDRTTGEPVLPRKTGGYSGPGIFPVALASVYKLREQFAGIPIAGAGGVSTAQDAQAMLNAGATLVQVGCASFTQPMRLAELAQAL
ncbi:MAG: tRNA-dihydrouridine synthase [Vampirovibrionales bacterium]|nr:tRNA-dihydrouridine synthase [Vampirovibrionales bacterium]